jgi:uncharacterized membrane protein YczE
MWSGTWQDLRFAARTLLRQPAAVMTAVLLLGIGIGAGTVLFSAVDTLSMRLSLRRTRTNWYRS